MSYVRFVLDRKDPNSGVAAGLFDAAWELNESSRIAATDRERLSELDRWFDDHLPSPARRSVSKSKSIYQHNTRGIAWFKDTATECISRMRDLAALLEKYGYRVEMIREDRVGYIVYEDEFQIVAEPFADTRTEGD